MASWTSRCAQSSWRTPSGSCCAAPPRAALVGLELVQRGLHLPPLPIQCRQLGRRGALGVGDGGDEPIPLRLARAAGIVQAVVDDPHRDPFVLGLALAQLAAPGAILEDLQHLQRDVLAAAPHQLRAGRVEGAPPLQAAQALVDQQQHSRPQRAPERGASEPSPRCSPPMAASTTAWVPHSTSPPGAPAGTPPARGRLWAGRTPPGWRACPARPGWCRPTRPAATPDTTPPSSCGWPAAGRPRRTAPAAAPAQPCPGPGDRALVRDLPAALPASGPRQALDQHAHDLLVAHLGEQAHGQGGVEDHAGGQQPLALLGPAGLGDHPIHQLGREGPGQHPDRDPIRQARHDRWLGLAGSWHPRVITSGHQTLPGARPASGDATTPTVAIQSGRGDRQQTTAEHGVGCGPLHSDGGTRGPRRT
jgi:hypothetical protein